MCLVIFHLVAENTETKASSHCWNVNIGDVREKKTLLYTIIMLNQFTISDLRPDV